MPNKYPGQDFYWANNATVRRAEENWYKAHPNVRLNVPTAIYDQEDSSGWKDFRRTSDQILCEVCQFPLYRHAQPLKEACPTMIEDCAGNWWKT